MLSFSLDECRYADPAVDTRISRLGDILFGRSGAPALGELRARFLSPEERLRIEQEEEEDV